MNSGSGYSARTQLCFHVSITDRLPRNGRQAFSPLGASVRNSDRMHCFSRVIHHFDRVIPHLRLRFVISQLLSPETAVSLAGISTKALAITMDGTNSSSCEVTTKIIAGALYPRKPADVIGKSVVCDAFADWSIDCRFYLNSRHEPRISRRRFQDTGEHRSRQDTICSAALVFH